MARRAVVIGSNGPEESSPLRFAKRDAVRIADTLASPRCAFEVFVVDTSQSAHDIERQIASIVENSDREDTLVVYFSGHGSVERGGLHLMLDHTTKDKILSTALSADALLRYMRFCESKQKLLILDCCHAGFAYGEDRFRDDQRARIADLVGSDDLENEAFVALLASDRLERARELEKLEGGFLTHSICKALSDSFKNADADGDGAINLDDLKHWLNLSAKQHNKAHPESRVPVPFFYGRIRGEFFLSKNPNHWQSQTLVLGDGKKFCAVPARSIYSGTGLEVWHVADFPVTNGQYRRFVELGHGVEPAGFNFNREKRQWTGPFFPWRTEEFSDSDQPVVCVDYQDALRFAKWLSWEQGLPFELVPTEVWHCAAFQNGVPTGDRRKWLQPSFPKTSVAPTGYSQSSSHENKFGIRGLFGNVWEWTQFVLAEHFVDNIARIADIAMGYEDQPDCEDWKMRNVQLRGGSFLDDLERIEPTIAAGTLSDGVLTKHSDLGFRLSVRIPFEQLTIDLIEQSELFPVIELPVVAATA